MPLAYMELSVEDLEELASREETLAVIPLGSLEQHCQGPLGLDSMIAERLAYDACREVEARGRVRCVILPTLHYGYSPEWSRVKGTISIPPGVYIELLEAIVESLVNTGFKRIVILNAHGGNATIAEATLRDIASKHQNIVVALLNYWEPLGLRLDHAGPVEELIARILGLNYNMGECGSVGYRSKPRVTTGAPREPARMVLEEAKPQLTREELITTIARILEEIAYIDRISKLV